METLSQKSSKNRMFCFVDGCFTTSARNKNLGFHQFPASERKTVVKISKNGIKRIVNRRQLWIEALNIDKEATTVIDQMRVCSLHFSKNDFIAKDKKRPFGFLKETAVPRRNLPLRKNSKLTTSLQFRNFNRIKWRGRLAFQDPDGRLPVSRRRYLGSHRKSFGVPNDRPVSTKNEATQSEERTYSEICEGEDLGGGKIQLKTFSLSGRDKLEFVKELKEQIVVDGGNDVKCDDDNDVQFSMEKSDTLPQPVMSYEIEIKEEPLSDVEQCQDSQDNYSWEAGDPTGDVDQIQDDNVPADAAAEKNQEDSEDNDAALEEEEEEEEEEDDDDEGSEDDEEDDDVSEGTDKNVRWRDRPCKICGKVDCKGHSTDHLNKKAFVCIVCDDIFESQELLDRHSRIHKQKNSKSLTAREQMYHQQKELTCKVCKKVLATRLTLKEHMLIHTGEKPHVCMLCGRTFRHKANLVVHINAHTIVRTFECPMCPETFSMRVDLEDHKKTHTDQQHTCSICKDSFHSKRALWTHQQIHNKRTQRKKRRSGRKTGLPCRLCGKMLSTKNTLKEHMMIHSGEKPHECLLCGKTIRHKANFIIHVQSHSNSEVFSCDLCDLEFSKKNDLRHHKSESHGTKSFSCMLCGAVFRKEESLMHHVETRHGDNPSSKTENEEEFEEIGNAFQPHLLEGLG